MPAGRNRAWGAADELLENCVIYSRILFIALTPFVLQNVFQSFFVTAEKPSLSLKISIGAGLTNVALDFLFIAVFHWGIAGAAIATGIGQLVGGFVPILYFSRKNDSLLRLTKTELNKRVLLKTFGNGSSEMVTNLSTSLVNILYNFQLMKLAGENGIAAYGIIMYVNFIFMAIFFGYSIGSAPIIGYHYGAGNRDELKNLFRKSIFLVGVTGIFLTLLAELLTVPLVTIFASYDARFIHYDLPRFPAVFPCLRDYGNQCLGLLLFYRARKRRCFRGNLLSADSGVSDCRDSRAAIFPGY